MKWLLDTNVVSETARAKAHSSMLGWLAQQPTQQLAISIVTSAELSEGAALHPDEARRRALQDWIDVTVADMFADRVLPLTAEIVGHWLRLSRRLAARRITRQAPDLLIAATARVHDLILVSRNLKDFADTGVLLFDPWNGRHHQMDEP